MTSRQQGHWASRLISTYATAFYRITLSLGWANSSLENGKLRRITKKLRCYAIVASFLQVLLMSYYLVATIHNSLHTKIGLSVELYVPTFLFLITADIFIIHLHILNAFRHCTLHAFIKNLCELRAKTERLMSTFEEFKGYALFTPFHCKAFGIYVTIESFHFAYHSGTIVVYALGNTRSWTRFINTSVGTVLIDLHQRSFVLMFVVALIVVDAIAHRMEDLLPLTLGSIDTRQLKLQEEGRRVLLDLYAWCEEANRLFAVPVFMHYSMIFLDALVTFYCVYAGVFGNFSDSPAYYVTMGVQLIKHSLVNQYAEHTRHSFRRAIDAVERVHLRRRSCIRPEEHLLLLYSRKMSFRCGTFTIERSLTIIIYAEIFMYILTLVQFKLGQDLLSKL